MRLVGFQVQMYRCVMDSTWIPVTPLTVLVGKNESGKTAILKALHKLNPFHPEPYHLREWPRGHRGTRSPEQVVCTAEFELSARARAEDTNALTDKIAAIQLATKNAAEASLANEKASFAAREEAAANREAASAHEISALKAEEHARSLRELENAMGELRQAFASFIDLLSLT